LSTITDSARTGSSSVRNRWSARTGRRPRQPCHRWSKYSVTSTNVSARILHAPRANRVYRKHGSGKHQDSLGLSTRSPIARGYAFHPRAIGDPRGRAAVRASSSDTVRSILPRLPMSPPDHCALRAPTVVSVRMESASVRKPRFWL